MVKAISLAVIMSGVQLLLAVPALAQGAGSLAGSPITDQSTPLIPGAYSSLPNQVAPAGQPPPIGAGSIPAPVNPGMGGPPTLIPSVPALPANNIDFPSYVVPYSPASLSAPGQLGPSTYAPPAPSTPGFDPGIVHPSNAGFFPPVSVVPINPAGGIYGAAPITKWGGQDTRDFGRYRQYKGPMATRRFDFGIQDYLGSNSQDGPYQTRPGAVPTQDLYGRRFPMRNNGSPVIQTVAPY